MKTMSDFKKYYTTALKPDLSVFEAKRKAILNNLYLVIGGAVLVCGGGVALILGTGAEPGFLLIPAILGIGGIALAWWWLTKDYVKQFKNTIIAKVVKFIDTGLSYSPTEMICQSEFKSSMIFQHRIDRYKGEDMVAGKLDKTAVRFSELHAEYKTESTDSKGHKQTHWHTIFKGLFFVADFNKHFSGNTVVVPDVAQRMLGWLGQKIQEMNFTRPGELIKLEDPEFEKLFAVYGSDQIESRYILSPSLMKRITDFRKSTGKEVFLSFVHSNVYVAITTGKDMFEPRIFRTLLDFKVCGEYFEDLSMAVGIVDELNLNTRIWTKE